LATVSRHWLAAGLTAAGFGAGAAATVVPIREVISSHGYQTAFMWFGIGQGLALVILSQLLRAPKPGEANAPAQRRVQQTTRDHSPAELVRSPLFWVLYVMFVAVAAPGIALTAQLASVAKDFGVADSPIVMFGVAGTALTLALTIDNVLNGLARPFFGWVSDHIGREVTMFIVFCAGAVSMLGLGYLGTDPIMFLAFGGLVYFTWGEIYSLFPATCTDAFGTRYATTNAGMLYTAKGTAALLVPLASLVVVQTGSWHVVFVVAAVLDLVAAVMALTMLEPMLRAAIQRG